MAYHPRIESPTLPALLTTRSRNSELWLINNRPLEEAILGYVGKFSKRYNAKIYAFAIEGNHTHCPALFPCLNRSSFMRDLNSCIARSVKRLVPEYPGGRFWGRRYSSEFLPGNEDLEEYFFYTVLQPIKDGLVERLADYPGYNCFRDAIWGIERSFKVVDWARYNSMKRYNKAARLDDYIELVTLRFERLPGYESLSQAQYAKLMQQKLEQRRQKILLERRRNGLGFLGRQRLLGLKRGCAPVSTKTSSYHTHRPRILSVDHSRRALYRAWYFTILRHYRLASKAFRDGNRAADFPPGTFLPSARSQYPPPLKRIGRPKLKPR